MQYIIKPMNEQSAQTIAKWHYKPPYDFYNMDQDPEDLAELLNPHNWDGSYYIVVNEHDTLIGFFIFITRPGNSLEIGLGLHPDLTGQGFGLNFLLAGLAFAREQFAPQQLSLKVATFNKRAIKLYIHAGFQAQETYLQSTNGGTFEFLQMIRPV
jgi:ribosomal-protein-alanine N-acetyltransferase